MSIFLQWSLGIVWCVFILCPVTECHFDWTELADEIQKGNWCNSSSHCRPPTSSQEWSGTSIINPNEMTDTKSV